MRREQERLCFLHCMRRLVCHTSWSEKRRLTRLHTDEAGPGIVCAAVAKTRDERRCHEREIGMVKTDLCMEVRLEGLPLMTQLGFWGFRS